MHIGLIPAVRFEESSQRAIPVIGLYYLASYLEEYGQDIKVTVYKKLEEILADKPDMAGISSVTENMNIAVSWAEEIKNKLNIPLILGGNHISALPHTLPEPLDVGVLGEGEETFLQLANLIQKESQWRKKLKKIQGICFRDGETGEVVKNTARALIHPITKIPFPRREEKVWGGFHYCFSSRGCPYHCTFCSPTKIWKCYRPFPADYVAEELSQIFRFFNPFYIHFFDDLFIGDRERVKKLRHLINAYGLNRRCNFGGHIRADLMDDELCRDLRGMNFTSGSFGAESGSDKILKFLKTGSTSVEMNQKAIDICHRNGIQLNLSFIIGTPGETEEDIKKTMDFIEFNKGKLMGMEVFILLPYPGTPIWTLAKRKGAVSDNMNWDLFRTKAFFSEIDEDMDFVYINEAMDRKTFGKYIRIFKEIDGELNRNNLKIYETIEKTIPSEGKKGNSLPPQ